MLTFKLQINHKNKDRPITLGTEISPGNDKFPQRRTLRPHVRPTYLPRIPKPSRPTHRKWVNDDQRIVNGKQANKGQFPHQVI